MRVGRPRGVLLKNVHDAHVNLPKAVTSGPRQGLCLSMTRPAVASRLPS
jgi:hypothetical protein